MGIDMSRQVVDIGKNLWAKNYGATEKSSFYDHEIIGLLILLLSEDYRI
jgi:hypothetical protein